MQHSHKNDGHVATFYQWTQAGFSAASQLSVGALLKRDWSEQTTWAWTHDNETTLWFYQVVFSVYFMRSFSTYLDTKSMK